MVEKDNKPPQFEKWKLLNLQVQGERATASISESFTGPRPEPVVFRRVNGEWKIDQQGRYGVTTSELPKSKNVWGGSPQSTANGGRSDSAGRGPRTIADSVRRAAINRAAYSAQCCSADGCPATAGPAQPEPEELPADLSGIWKITFPLGATRNVNILKLPGNRYKLVRTGAMDGIYEVKDRTLAVVEPNNQPMSGLEWQSDDGQLVLVSEPTPPPTGSSYVRTHLCAGQLGKRKPSNRDRQSLAPYRPAAKVDAADCTSLNPRNCLPTLAGPGRLLFRWEQPET